jgi:hypothetical protein
MLALKSPSSFCSSRSTCERTRVSRNRMGEDCPGGLPLSRNSNRTTHNQHGRGFAGQLHTMRAPSRLTAGRAAGRFRAMSPTRRGLAGSRNGWSIVTEALVRDRKSSKPLNLRMRQSVASRWRHHGICPPVQTWFHADGSSGDRALNHYREGLRWITHQRNVVLQRVFMH